VEVLYRVSGTKAEGKAANLCLANQIGSLSLSLHSSNTILYKSFTFQLYHFSPEAGDSRFLRNVGIDL
jgi:hypothetical protein